MADEPKDVQDVLQDAKNEALVQNMAARARTEGYAEILKTLAERLPELSEKFQEMAIHMLGMQDAIDTFLEEYLKLSEYAEAQDNSNTN